MSDNFEQISTKSGFMKHNGGLFFRTISEKEYEFKTTINENHLNAAGITHGGFISAIVDDGAGTAANTDQEVTSYEIAYTVSDAISVSYGTEEIARPDNASDQDIEVSGVVATYTAGGMTITGKMENADNVDNSNNANADQEFWGLTAAFAF